MAGNPCILPLDLPQRGDGLNHVVRYVPGVAGWQELPGRYRLGWKVQQHGVRASREVRRGVLVAEYLDPAVFGVQAAAAVEDRAREFSQSHRGAHDGCRIPGYRNREGSGAAVGFCRE